jgi:hypothetical protein
MYTLHTPIGHVNMRHNQAALPSNIYVKDDSLTEPYALQADAARTGGFILMIGEVFRGGTVMRGLVSEAEAVFRGPVPPRLKDKKLLYR